MTRQATRSPVDEALAVQSDEGLLHGARQVGVHRESLTGPVDRGSQAPQLRQDLAAVLLLPLPHLGHERLAS